jgi:hypothetical protein
VIDEVVGEQFVEQGEVAAALNFFGIASHDRFRGLAGIGSHSVI